jgi:hypothetical protein
VAILLEEAFWLSRLVGDNIVRLENWRALSSHSGE